MAIMDGMDGLDILAIAAHRDDVELTCGGALLKAHQFGRTTGIVDLTAGEAGSRGSAEIRGAEANRAARILGVSVRENMNWPDAGITQDTSRRDELADVIRRLRPRVVIAPAMEGRHPDHIASAQLIRAACFVAGLAKLSVNFPPHRPFKILHAIAYREDNIRPSFLVDISDVFEKKLEAIRCYGSQFDNAIQAGEVYPTGENLYDVIRHQSAHYGSLIRTRYAEPFLTTENMRFDDIGALEVSTF